MLKATTGRRAALLRSLHKGTTHRPHSSSGGIGGGASLKATVPPRPKSITAHERAQLRANRRQQASQSMEGQSSNEATAATANAGTSSSIPNQATKVQKPLDSRLVFGVGVGLPTALLAWGIADETSPPAKLSKLIGLTDMVERYAEGFARPSREKLLPDWEFVSTQKHLLCFLGV